ncbi:acyl-CoA dehydrogenase family protein [Mycobacterium avium subsp. hominissuis]
MTLTDEASDLLALRELADDIFFAATEPVLDAQERRLAYDPVLWSTLCASGLTLMTTPEELGGSGAGLRELAVVLESAGYHAAPVPIAEHDLLASWLLRSAGLTPSAGPMTSAVSTATLSGRHLTATLDSIPWADVAELVVIAGDGFVAAIPRRDYAITAGADLAGQPCDRVHVDTEIDAARIGSVSAGLGMEFQLRGALARSLQTCGALARALDLSCVHVQQREQFGRPIAKFQAVQKLIADAAGALAVAKTATDFAIAAASSQGFCSSNAQVAVSVAKIETARAATVVARNAHQVHGAIGFTLDHRLRHFTTRALAWRSEFGAQYQWRRRLGHRALESAGTLWEFVTESPIGPAVNAGTSM